MLWMLIVLILRCEIHSSKYHLNVDNVYHLNQNSFHITVAHTADNFRNSLTQNVSVTFSTSSNK